MHKYTIPEIERRRIAKQDLLPDLSTLCSFHIQDHYIKNTRMRLRKQAHTDGKIVYKLCKKYWKTSAIREDIVNIYVDEHEYNLLLTLPATVLHKTRYIDEKNACDINIFADWKVIIEREFTSEEEANAFIPPSYCGLDVSDSVVWESATIAGK